MLNFIMDRETVDETDSFVKEARMLHQALRNIAQKNAPK